MSEKGPENFGGKSEEIPKVKTKQEILKDLNSKLEEFKRQKEIIEHEHANRGDEGSREIALQNLNSLIQEVENKIKTVE